MKLILCCFASVLGVYAQTPTVSAIANGASFSSTISPGTIVAIFGSDFGDTAADTTVTVDGLTARTLSVSNTQINALLPFNLPLGPAALSINVQGALSATVELTISPYAPALFTTNSRGTGRGIFTNASGQPLPASGAGPGETIIAYATGLGATNPPADLQTPEKSLQCVEIPTVTVGGVAARVVSATLSTNTPVTYQVSFVVPEVGSWEQSFVISIGEMLSPPVTLLINSTNRSSLESSVVSSGSISPAGVVYTCDPGISTTVCNTLNTATAALYSSAFTNANVSIYIMFGNTGLGENTTSLFESNYTAVRNALIAGARGPNDTTAINDSVPVTNPFGTTSVFLTNADARALGFAPTSGLRSNRTTTCQLSTTGCYDGIIVVSSAENSGGALYFRTGPAITASQYDFYSVVEHETDEVLGTASCAFGCSGYYFPADLYRYHSNGTRSFAIGDNTSSCSVSDSGNACLSLDGVHMLQQYNNAISDEDAGDWLTNCAAPLVQDAEGCPGVAFVDISPVKEILLLDVVGFTLTSTSTAPPAAPVLISPANGATGVTRTPTLTWNAAPGATSYDVYFGTSSTPPMVTNISTTSYAPSTLAGGTTYYWHIVARNANGTTDSGSSWSFITVPAAGAPGIPVLVSPANGARAVSTTVTLTWNASTGATSYDVYFGTADPPPLLTNTTGTSEQPGTLASSTQYYWFVVAKNASGSETSATWTFITQGPGLQFYTLPPCRMVDTRVGQGKAGAFGPPALAASVERDFPLFSSGCGVPASAAAYSLNITAVPSGPLSFLSVWPTGEPYPGVSTLNSNDGSIIANAAIVPAGTGGNIALVPGNPTDVIIDINGYFASTGGVSALDFYPLTPCRIADTRVGQGKTGAFGPPSLAESVVRDFPLSTSPCLSGSPVAYSLNMTVVPDGPLSFLSTWPTGTAYPNVSTLNSSDGIVLANAAIVPAGTNGDINVLPGDPTDLIIDINGIFALPGAGGLRFYAVTPCRLADTRTSQGFTGSFGPPSLVTDVIRNFPIQSSSCGIPATAQAYALNMTAVPQGPLSFLSVWPTGQSYPGVSTLNSSDGNVIANAAIVPAGTGGGISVLAAAPTDLIIDIVGYFAP